MPLATMLPVLYLWLTVNVTLRRGFWVWFWHQGQCWPRSVLFHTVNELLLSVMPSVPVCWKSWWAIQTCLYVSNYELDCLSTSWPKRVSVQVFRRGCYEKPKWFLLPAQQIHSIVPFICFFLEAQVVRVCFLLAGSRSFLHPRQSLSWPHPPHSPRFQTWVANLLPRCLQHSSPFTSRETWSGVPRGRLRRALSSTAEMAPVPRQPVGRWHWPPPPSS